MIGNSDTTENKLNEMINEIATLKAKNMVKDDNDEVDEQNYYYGSNNENNDNYDYDYDNESYNSDHDIDEVKSEDNENVENNIKITTAGVYDYNPRAAFCCVMCQKYYNNDMCTTQDSQEKICYHCLFSMNYPPEMRNMVDGTFGLTIVEYILKCSPDHNQETCTYRTDVGGCFLCEYQLGFPIMDVIDADKLNVNLEIRMYEQEEKQKLEHQEKLWETVRNGSDNVDFGDLELEI